jgi:hypothetical protein
MNLADLVGWQDFGPLRIFGRRKANVRPLEELYDLSLLGTLDRLYQIREGQKKEDFIFLVLGAVSRLKNLIDWPYNAELMPESVKAASALIETLMTFRKGENQQVSSWNESAIIGSYRTFQTHLKAELNDLPVFLIENTRAYTPKILIEQSHKVWSKDAAQMLESLPTAQTDIAEAAKCLAFDRPTATGFHALRAVEEVTRCYYSMITGRSYVERDPQTNQTIHFRTLAAMKNELKIALPNLQKKEDVGHLPLILVLLEQLTELYRNPLDHPELPELKPDEGVDVFNHAINVISEIFREIRTRKYFAHTFG